MLLINFIFIFSSKFKTSDAFPTTDINKVKNILLFIDISRAFSNEYPQSINICIKTSLSSHNSNGFYDCYCWRKVY